MAWRENITTGIKDFLRLLILGALLCDLIIVAVFSTYFVLRVVLKAVDFMEREWFA